MIVGLGEGRKDNFFEKILPTLLVLYLCLPVSEFCLPLRALSS
jgi:hypothetical protein